MIWHTPSGSSKDVEAKIKRLIKAQFTREQQSTRPAPAPYTLYATATQCRGIYLSSSLDGERWQRKWGRITAAHKHIGDSMEGFGVAATAACRYKCHFISGRRSNVSVSLVVQIKNKCGLA